MQIEELLNNKAFAAQVENAKDLAEVAALFQAQGAEVTEDELNALLAAEEGELNEAALENVAGGLIHLSPLINPLQKWLKSLLLQKKKK